jgi:hypothetical protein
MEELLYEWMTSSQAADALDEFLTERAAAMQHLRSELITDGLDPDDVLDCTLGTVPPVWEWVTARAADLGVDPHALEDDPTRPAWPSWARYGMLVDPHPPAATIRLVDGFTSYLAQMITTAVPVARWQVGQHRISDYPMRNRPVLAAGGHEVFLPAFPLYGVYQSAQGRDPMSGTEMLHHVRRTISSLRGEGPDASCTDEPWATVVSEVDCLDVGLRADIVEQHPQLVEQLIADLTDRDGVTSVHRYGPAALVVDVRGWDELRLQMWLTLWLQRHLPR